jgi:hypothetical protein
MNIQEDINRIKQVMGLNESVPLTIKRKLDILPKYIRSTYKWLDANFFVSFDDYIERVAFSSTRDFVSDQFESSNYEEHGKITDNLMKFTLQYIKENLMEEIMDYFNKSRAESSDWVKPYMGINEEHEEPTHALIKILPLLAYMDEKYRYQIVPYHATQRDKIYIKKGSAGHKTISTKNVKVMDTGSEEEMEKKLSKLKDE